MLASLQVGLDSEVSTNGELMMFGEIIAMANRSPGFLTGILTLKRPPYVQSTGSTRVLYHHLGSQT